MISGSNLTNGHGIGSNPQTASVSPSASALILVSIVQTENSTPNPPTPSISGCGMTWTQIINYNPFADVRITVFRGQSAVPSAGAISITRGGDTNGDTYWSVDQFTGVYDDSANNGAAVIIQHQENNITGNSTGLTVSLAALQNASDASFGIILNKGGHPPTPGSNFTQLSDYVGIINAEWAINQTEVNWTWSYNAANYLAAALEILANTTTTSTSTTSTSSSTSTSTTTTSTSTSTTTTSTSTSTTTTITSTSTTTTSTSSTTTSTSTTTTSTSTSSSTSTTTTLTSTSTSSSTSTSTSTTITIGLRFIVEKVR